MKKYYQSLTMGNIVENRLQILAQILESLFKYKTADFRWIKIYMEG